MLLVCQPRLSHFQGGGFRGNWCCYGERIDNPKRHSQSGEVVAADFDSLHRGARVRAGGKTLLVLNPRNRDHGKFLWGGMLQRASWAWSVRCCDPPSVLLRDWVYQDLVYCGGWAGRIEVPRRAARAPQDDRGFAEVAVVRFSHVAGLLLLLLVSLNGIPLWAQQRAEAPIALHPKNPHYFLYRDRAVALVGSGEHYGAVLNGDFDYHKYLATLTADGMNYTRLFGGSYVEVPAKSFGILRNDLAPAEGRFVAPWARSSEPGYAGGGNKFDLEKWNPEYFSRLHDFLGEAARRGIVVEITLFSSQYGEMQWNVSPFKRENNVNSTDAVDWKKLNTLDNGNILAYQERYARKLVREANAYPNVIFEIANEPWSDRPVLADVVNPYLFTGRDQYPNSVDLPDGATMQWQARVAGWIAAEEAGLANKHLVAQDCCNFRYAARDVLPGVSVVNFHYAYPEAATLNYGLGKALSYDETGFLGTRRCELCAASLGISCCREEACSIIWITRSAWGVRMARIWSGMDRAVGVRGCGSGCEF